MAWLFWKKKAADTVEDLMLAYDATTAAAYDLSVFVVRNTILNTLPGANPATLAIAEMMAERCVRSIRNLIPPGARNALNEIQRRTAKREAEIALATIQHHTRNESTAILSRRIQTLSKRGLYDGNDPAN